MALPARLRRAYLTAPGARDWIEAGLGLAAFTALALPLALHAGLAAPSPRDLAAYAPAALLAFFVPALAEETLFRAPIPDRPEAKRAIGAILASTAAFTAWHAIETLWLPKAAPIFLRPEFLVIAMSPGLVCAILRRRSGSIWTAVAVHWIVVVGWQGWLGGPNATALH